ncbi:MAG: hypothetical protein QXX95_00215 [Nitrososphaerales archaeon]
MRKEIDSLKHFKRVFKDAKAQVVRDLVEAIKGDKYWKAMSKDYLFLLALSRARLPYGKYYLAKTTHFKRVLVEEEIAKYCRRGRVLMVRKDRGNLIAEKILSWEAFVKFMRRDCKEKIEELIMKSDYKLIGKRELAYLIKEKDSILKKQI